MLTEEARSRYVRAWRAVQAQLADRPEAAVRDADLLVSAVMIDRGYPMDDLETHPALVCVPSTDDLRAAFCGYRALFEELLEDRAGEADSSADGRRRGLP